LSSEETYFENIYNVNTEGKVVKYNTSSDSVELSTTEVSDAKYYGNDSFSKIAVGEKATYDDMIKAYKEILKTDAKEIENMMNLTLKEKQNFVKGDSAVASKFLQPLQDEIRLILACCGFIAEEV